jgi:hypothetical protein
MLCVGVLGSRIVQSLLVSSQAEVAKSKEVRCVRAAGVESVQAAGKEQGVFNEAVVQVVVYELAQLGIDAWGC